MLKNGAKLGAFSESAMAGFQSGKNSEGELSGRLSDHVSKRSQSTNCCVPQSFRTLRSETMTDDTGEERLSTGRLVEGLVDGCMIEASLQGPFHR